MSKCSSVAGGAAKVKSAAEQGKLSLANASKIAAASAEKFTAFATAAEATITRPCSTFKGEGSPKQIYKDKMQHFEDLKKLENQPKNVYDQIMQNPDSAVAREKAVELTYNQDVQNFNREQCVTIQTLYSEASQDRYNQAYTDGLITKEKLEAYHSAGKTQGNKYNCLDKNGIPTQGSVVEEARTSTYLKSSSRSEDDTLILERLPDPKVPTSGENVDNLLYAANAATGGVGSTVKLALAAKYPAALGASIVSDCLNTIMDENNPVGKFFKGVSDAVKATIQIAKDLGRALATQAVGWAKSIASSVKDKLVAVADIAVGAALKAKDAVVGTVNGFVENQIANAKERAAAKKEEAAARLKAACGGAT